ncbi:DUF998 domain-containing protein [Promicromonospora iranensis]|uniref:DUF998 domain-containing protein n=1 Tax=Promicromonospora iranensis TaxID=1105144 RepID=A0ABU2CT73_9MICO|nr:DUF998 domain-containing protein [Promicromonospora iranensis]MDR7384543.1 hypothetical protein [Promicromonospora iranensis]
MTFLLWSGALGSWLFIVTFLLDGWTRPGYRPVRHAVSALALGSRGWLQTTNFIVCGLAITAGAVGLASALDSVLLALVVAVFGVALVASGVFPMDPMRAYPPGTPDETPTEVSTRASWCSVRPGRTTTRVPASCSARRSSSAGSGSGSSSPTRPDSGS